MAPVSRSVTPMGTRSGPSPTQTQTQTPEPEVAITRQAVLHLRGAPNLAGRAEVEQDEGGDTRTRRRIQWAEDVVDNEGLGRKKSKGVFEILQSCSYILF
jgi:protein phosphatase 1 regulatory subunit 11